MSLSEPHIPVMLPEVLAALHLQDNATYLDTTFGAGGYSRAILKGADCRLFAIDRDPSVTGVAEALRAEAGDRFCFMAGCFSQMVDLLADQGVERVDGIVMDIGVSSMQLDQAERGFSFMKEGPLDMRQSQQGMTAADVVNTMEEQELADILYRYGEERKSRSIARAIVRRREEKPFVTTTELAGLIASVNPVRGKNKHKEIHPATRSFQALRIYVNRELDELEDALEAAENLLNDGGRLVVVTFHSLEDRIVKQFLRDRAGENSAGSRHLPVEGMQGGAKTMAAFTMPMRKAVLASDAEIAVNPRSRSAKLRWAIRQKTIKNKSGEV